MRGRAPRPAQKRLTADPHKSRRPKPPPTDPNPSAKNSPQAPTWLGDSAAHDFDAAAAHTHSAGATTGKITAALTQYAAALEVYRLALAELRGEGLTDIDGKPSGAFRVWKDAAQELRRATQELGATPLSAQRLPAAGGGEAPPAVAPRART